MGLVFIFLWKYALCHHLIHSILGGTVCFSHSLTVGEEKDKEKKLELWFVLGYNVTPPQIKGIQDFLVLLRKVEEI